MEENEGWMEEAERKMGKDGGRRGEDEGKWSEFSWNPACQEAAPSVGSRPRSVWHHCLAGFVFLLLIKKKKKNLHSIFIKQQLLVRIGLLLVVAGGKKKKVTTRTTTTTTKSTAS